MRVDSASAPRKPRVVAPGVVGPSRTKGFTLSAPLVRKTSLSSTASGGTSGEHCVAGRFGQAQHVLKHWNPGGGLYALPTLKHAEPDYLSVFGDDFEDPSLQAQGDTIEEDVQQLFYGVLDSCDLSSGAGTAISNIYRNLSQGKTSTTFASQSELQSKVRTSSARLLEHIQDIEDMGTGNLLSVGADKPMSSLLSFAGPLATSDLATRMTELKEQLQELNWPRLHGDLRKWVRRARDIDRHTRPMLEQGEEILSDFIVDSRLVGPNLLGEREKFILAQAQKFYYSLADCSEDYKVRVEAFKASLVRKDDEPILDAPLNFKRRRSRPAVLAQKPRGSASFEFEREDWIEVKRQRLTELSMRRLKEEERERDHANGGGPSRDAIQQGLQLPEDEDIDISLFMEPRFTHLRGIFEMQKNKIQELKLVLKQQEKELNERRANLVSIMSQAEEDREKKFVNDAFANVIQSMSVEMQRKMHLRRERKQLLSKLNTTVCTDVGPSYFEAIEIEDSAEERKGIASIGARADNAMDWESSTSNGEKVPSKVRPHSTSVDSTTLQAEAEIDALRLEIENIGRLAEQLVVEVNVKAAELKLGKAWFFNPMKFDAITPLCSLLPALFTLLAKIDLLVPKLDDGLSGVSELKRSARATQQTLILESQARVQFFHESVASRREKMYDISAWKLQMQCRFAELLGALGYVLPSSSDIMSFTAEARKSIQDIVSHTSKPLPAQPLGVGKAQSYILDEANRQERVSRVRKTNVAQAAAENLPESSMDCDRELRIPTARRVSEFLAEDQQSHESVSFQGVHSASDTEVRPNELTITSDLKAGEVKINYSSKSPDSQSILSNVIKSKDLLKDVKPGSDATHGVKHVKTGTAATADKISFGKDLVSIASMEEKGGKDLVGVPDKKAKGSNHSVSAASAEAKGGKVVVSVAGEEAKRVKDSASIATAQAKRGKDLASVAGTAAKVGKVVTGKDLAKELKEWDIRFQQAEEIIKEQKFVHDLTTRLRERCATLGTFQSQRPSANSSLDNQRHGSVGTGGSAPVGHLDSAHNEDVERNVTESLGKHKAMDTLVKRTKRKHEQLLKKRLNQVKLLRKALELAGLKEDATKLKPIETEEELLRRLAGETHEVKDNVKKLRGMADLWVRRLTVKTGRNSVTSEQWDGDDGPQSPRGSAAAIDPQGLLSSPTHAVGDAFQPGVKKVPHAQDAGLSASRKSEMEQKAFDIILRGAGGQAWESPRKKIQQMITVMTNPFDRAKIELARVARKSIDSAHSRSAWYRLTDLFEDSNPQARLSSASAHVNETTHASEAVSDASKAEDGATLASLPPLATLREASGRHPESSPRQQDEQTKFENEKDADLDPSEDHECLEKRDRWSRARELSFRFFNRIGTENLEGKVQVEDEDSHGTDSATSAVNVAPEVDDADLSGEEQRTATVKFSGADWNAADRFRSKIFSQLMMTKSPSTRSQQSDAAKSIKSMSSLLRRDRSDQLPAEDSEAHEASSVGEVEVAPLSSEVSAESIISVAHSESEASSGDSERSSKQSSLASEVQVDEFTEIRSNLEQAWRKKLSQMPQRPSLSELVQTNTSSTGSRSQAVSRTSRRRRTSRQDSVIKHKDPLGAAFKWVEDIGRSEQRQEHPVAFKGNQPQHSMAPQASEALARRKSSMVAIGRVPSVKKSAHSKLLDLCLGVDKPKRRAVTPIRGCDDSDTESDIASEAPPVIESESYALRIGKLVGSRPPRRATRTTTTYRMAQEILWRELRTDELESMPSDLRRESFRKLVQDIAPNPSLGNNLLSHMGNDATLAMHMLSTTAKARPQGILRSARLAWSKLMETFGSEERAYNIALSTKGASNHLGKSRMLQVFSYKGIPTKELECLFSNVNYFNVSSYSFKRSMKFARPVANIEELRERLLLKHHKLVLAFRVADVERKGHIGLAQFCDVCVGVGEEASSACLHFGLLLLFSIATSAIRSRAVSNGELEEATLSECDFIFGLRYAEGHLVLQRLLKAKKGPDTTWFGKFKRGFLAREATYENLRRALDTFRLKTAEIVHLGRMLFAVKATSQKFAVLKIGHICKWLVVAHEAYSVSRGAWFSRRAIAFNLLRVGVEASIGGKLHVPKAPLPSEESRISDGPKEMEEKGGHSKGPTDGSKRQNFSDEDDMADNDPATDGDPAAVSSDPAAVSRGLTLLEQYSFLTFFKSSRAALKNLRMAKINPDRLRSRDEFVGLNIALFSLDPDAGSDLFAAIVDHSKNKKVSLRELINFVHTRKPLRTLAQLQVKLQERKAPPFEMDCVNLAAFRQYLEDHCIKVVDAEKLFRAILPQDNGSILCNVMNQALGIADEGRPRSNGKLTDTALIRRLSARKESLVDAFLMADREAASGLTLREFETTLTKMGISAEEAQQCCAKVEMGDADLITLDSLKTFLRDFLEVSPQVLSSFGTDCLQPSLVDGPPLLLLDENLCEEPEQGASGLDDSEPEGDVCPDHSFPEVSKEQMLCSDDSLDMKVAAEQAAASTRFVALGGEAKLETAVQCARAIIVLLRRRRAPRAAWGTLVGALRAAADEGVEDLVRILRASMPAACHEDDDPASPAPSSSRLAFFASSRSRTMVQSVHLRLVVQLIRSFDGEGDAALSAYQFCAPMPSFLGLQARLTQRFGSVASALAAAKTLFSCAEAIGAGSVQSAHAAVPLPFVRKWLLASVGVAGEDLQRTMRVLRLWASPDSLGASPTISDARPEDLRRIAWDDAHFLMRNGDALTRLEGVCGAALRSAEALREGVARLLPHVSSTLTHKDMAILLGLTPEVKAPLEKVVNLLRRVDSFSQAGAMVSRAGEFSAESLLVCLEAICGGTRKPSCGGNLDATAQTSFEFAPCATAPPPHPEWEVAVEAWRRLRPTLLALFPNGVDAIWTAIDLGGRNHLDLDTFAHRFGDLVGVSSQMSASMFGLVVGFKHLRWDSSRLPVRLQKSDLARGLRLASPISSLSDLRHRLVEEMGSLTLAFDQLHSGCDISYRSWIYGLRALWVTDTEAAKCFSLFHLQPDLRLSRRAFRSGMRSARGAEALASCADALDRSTELGGLVEAFRSLPLNEPMTQNDMEAACWNSWQLPRQLLGVGIGHLFSEGEEYLDETRRTIADLLDLMASMHGTRARLCIGISLASPLAAASHEPQSEEGLLKPQRRRTAGVHAASPRNSLSLGTLPQPPRPRRRSAGAMASSGAYPSKTKSALDVFRAQ